MSNRFSLTPSSEHPGWWVLADTETNVVIRWEEHRLNDTRKVSVLDTEITEHTTTDLARIMREMDDYIVRHHGGIAFDTPFGFEYSEDDAELFFCRYKDPKWRMKINENEIGVKQLANSLRKAAEFLNKRYN